MSNQAQILSLFEEGNPVPDIDGLELIDVDANAYLATLSTRSSRMTQVEDRIDEPVTGPRPGRTRWLVAATALALVLMIGGGIALLTAGDSETPPADETTTTQAPTTTAAADATTTTSTAPTTTTETPTTTVDPAVEAEALAAAESGFEAFNSGDAEGWTVFREADLGPPESVPEAMVTEASGLIAGGASFDVVDCESRGWGTMGIDAGLAEGVYIVCETIRSDRYRDTAELTVAERFDIVVDEGVVLAVAGNPINNSDIAFDRFLVDFKAWLAETHPEVFASITYIENIYPVAESAPIALEYVEEFAATLD